MTKRFSILKKSTAAVKPLLFKRKANIRLDVRFLNLVARRSFGIFDSFAYKFKLSRFSVKSLAYAHGEIKGLRLR